MTSNVIVIDDSNIWQFYTGVAPATGISEVTFTNGMSYPMPDSITQLVILAAGDLATATLTMPPNPLDQQVFIIFSSVNIAAFTLTPATDQTILAAITMLFTDTSAAYKWSQLAQTWYRMW